MLEKAAAPAIDCNGCAGTRRDEFGIAAFAGAPGRRKADARMHLLRKYDGRRRGSPWPGRLRGQGAPFTRVRRGRGPP